LIFICYGYTYILVFKDGSLTPTFSCFRPVLVLDLLLALPLTQQRKARLGLLCSDVGEVQRLLQVLFVLGLGAVVEKEADTVRRLEMRCALGVLLEERIVVSLQVGVGGRCGEGLLDDLGRLGRERL
jgi:hypothetical protein